MRKLFFLLLVIISFNKSYSQTSLPTTDSADIDTAAAPISAVGTDVIPFYYNGEGWVKVRPEWVYIGTPSPTRKEKYYCEYDVEFEDENTIRFWSKIDKYFIYKNKRKTYTRNKTLFKVSISSKQICILQSTDYDSNGKILKSDTSSYLDWFYPVPESMGAAIYKYAYDNFKLKNNSK